MKFAAVAPRVENAPGPNPGRRAFVLGWAGAYSLYALIYAAAVRLGFDLGVGTSLLAGAFNTLPEAVATPWVLRYSVRRDGKADSRDSGLAPAGRLALLALLFVVWCVVLSAIGSAALRGWDPAPWRHPLRYGNLLWKAIISLLVFIVVAAFAVARLQGRRAGLAAERALRAEALRAEARLAILRAQLNPHFVLNVLHSLVGLVERDARATAVALERLGTTLRYALRVQSRGDDRVALGDELAFTLDYLELERLRLGERLTTKVEVEQEALPLPVLPFVLQPLVENAVLHGIGRRARGGTVAISVARETDGLALRVEDDGEGLAAPDGPVHGSGLGLTLLRDRIAALYGKRGSLALDRSALGGLRATVRLAGEPAPPQEREEE